MMVTNEIPNFIAALIACLLMGKFRCIDMESAYKSIHWPSIILIVGMMPFALALQETGGIALAVDALMKIAGARAACHAAVFIYSLRHDWFVYFQHCNSGIDGANCNCRSTSNGGFTAAICHGCWYCGISCFYDASVFPVNTLVLGPGGYKFSDFLKIGVPLPLL